MLRRLRLPLAVLALSLALAGCMESEGDDDDDGGDDEDGMPAAVLVVDLPR
jgi:hypothetical protein